jgi:hypothetical protein
MKNILPGRGIIGGKAVNDQEIRAELAKLTRRIEKLERIVGRTGLQSGELIINKQSASDRLPRPMAGG